VKRGLNEENAEQKAREDLKAVSAAWEKAIISNDANAIGRFMTDD
jgi:ketosteroid isomerase-like protein